MASSVNDVCKALVQSGLHERKNVIALQQDWVREARGSDDLNRFSKWLVMKGYVTEYQMRLILTDYARSHLSAKRGSGEKKLPLEEDLIVSRSQPEDLLALEEALTQLALIDERKCRILEMRYFAGMTPEQTAEALGVSEPTIRRELRLARAFLRQQLTFS